uniref:C2H2-type domain-containing protein n=1 Tax=Nothobranchius kadleci TaxID=1051664 RepID=A0A1A8DBA7_NOTKA
MSELVNGVKIMALVKEEAHEEQSAGEDQQEPEHLHIKEEQDDLWTSLEREQLHLKETDAARFLFTAGSIKSEDDEEKLLFSKCHQQHDVPTSSSTVQMTAETVRNPDLNTHERTSDSSETEVSGEDEEDEDVNLEPELSESESKTGDRDNDWNKSRSFESDVETEQTEQKPFSCDVCRKRFDKNLI